MANPAGVLRGGDFSHHQKDIDIGRLPIEFTICRTAQAAGGPYATTRDGFYSGHKANALRAGKLFSAYFYLGTGLSAAANAALHAAIEPDRTIPVMLDWEKGSGDGRFLRACVEEFKKLGYFVWSIYGPRWYWDSVGRPDLSGLPPLVSSRYADNAPGDWEAEYRSTPEEYWSSYGGNIVRMLQFSSVVRHPVYPSRNTDGDAFKGTRADLAAWWNPNQPNPTPAPGELSQGGVEIVERITVTPPNANENSIHLNNLPGSPGTAIIVRPKAGATMWVGDVFAWGSDNVGIGHNPKKQPGYNPRLQPGAPRRIDLPGALWCDFNYSARPEDPFVIEIVG
ncbi:hypothetical protein [Amycolatopsis tolypomycina]|uniref:hypothetical protein n=1 Tax=Amycolatopsis tolypomycina TaxID=208445 RepID=UPI0033BCECF4